jgi:hypothetical protein
MATRDANQFPTAPLVLSSPPFRACSSGVASLHATTGPPMQGAWAHWASEGHAWMRSHNWLSGSAKIMPYFSLGAISENVEPYDGFELRLRPAHVEIGATGGVWGSKTMSPSAGRAFRAVIGLPFTIRAAAGYSRTAVEPAILIGFGSYDRLIGTT